MEVSGQIRALAALVPGEIELLFPSNRRLVYYRVGIEALGSEKEKTFDPAYNFSVYWLRNKVFVMDRELHFDVSPGTWLAIGDNETEKNCKFTKNVMELFN